MRNKRHIYWNDKQLQFLIAKQPTKVFVGGRGTGKSVSIAGKTHMRIRELPKAKGFFSSTTYKQILQSTLPAIENKLNEMGYIDGVHYVIGQKPPKHFESPYDKVREYDNVMSFWNGYTVLFLSMDRMDLRRGGSFDCGDVDEAALVKQEALNKVLMPSIRGNITRFNSHLHQQVCLYTSIPWKASGYYILDYEEKAAANPDMYFYLEADVYDNIQILGDRGIDRLKNELTYLEFQVECLNQRIRKVEGGFYFQFDEDVHSYEPSYEYGDGERGITLVGANDYKPDELIDTSWDFSGWFNAVALYQMEGYRSAITERMFDSFWVKQKGVKELVDKFCDTYMEHQFKYVRLWGEPRGLDRTEFGQNVYEEIKDRFERHGWQVEIMVNTRKTKMHIERYTYMNDILEEKNPRLPHLRINSENCRDVIIAHMTTDVNHDFRKDKSSERDRKFPQEHAPHFTDLNDYYFLQKHSWRMEEEHSGSGGDFAIH